ncbi:MAG: HAMP domain-containing protein [Treponema sp.]|jgi:adenylate cyclase|nr:HAMP domain-containing protein [Treponema sp.]
MNKQNKNRLSDKIIKFSIGAKLVTIITILVLISLGAITFLVSYMVSQDLEVSAYKNNIEINQRFVSEAENTIENIRSNSKVLVQIINTPAATSELLEQAVGFYFEQNSQVAAIFFPSGGREIFRVNNNFFREKDLDVSLVNSYYRENNSYYQRAIRGESIIQNVSYYFSTHLLALFFPVQGGKAISVLFSPENLDNNFSSRLNESCLINNDGDILIHPQFEHVMGRANISNREYVKQIRKNSLPGTNMQKLFEDEGVKYFIAYTKLKDGSTIAITMIEYKKIFQGIEATTRRNIYLTVAVVFLSILFIWFFSKTISTALKALSNAARKIEGGNFEIELTPKSHDEIGYLTTSFQRMSKALSIFGRFTNREIAIKAMRGEIKPGGLPKHATIFFSDIRGFTEKSEVFTNEFGKEASDKIVFWLNNYFTKMVNCVEKTNGVVDKYIGDAVMAHWGTAYSAGSPAKDAFNGVKAALMMRKEIVALNRRRRPHDPGDPPIIIGCGLNSGIVTAGQIGSDIRMEYTVIGDPVNLASRIEALNKPLGTDILISESTWNLVKYFFITEEMPPVSVKGKEKPVRIFAVVNHVSVTSGPRTLAQVRELLGIKPPDLSKVNVNADEKKYKIGASE